MAGPKKGKFRWPEGDLNRGVEALRFYVGAHGQLRATRAATAFKAPRLIIRGKSGKLLSPSFVKLVQGYIKQNNKKKAVQQSIDERTAQVHIKGRRSPLRRKKSPPLGEDENGTKT